MEDIFEKLRISGTILNSYFLKQQKYKIKINE